MAGNNPNVLKLPSRHHLIENACRRLQRDDEGPSRTHREDAASVVDELIDRGWLPVAPEPVAPKRGDLLTENTELVDRLAVRDADGEVFAYWESHNLWCSCDGIGETFTTEQVIKYQSRIIDVPGVVDTPEPAPKYVAERIDHDWIVVDGFGMATERVVLEAEIGRRQAALDLLDRESEQAIDQLRDKLAGEGGRS